VSRAERSLGREAGASGARPDDRRTRSRAIAGSSTNHPPTLPRLPNGQPRRPSTIEVVGRDAWAEAAVGDDPALHKRQHASRMKPGRRRNWPCHRLRRLANEARVPITRPYHVQVGRTRSSGHGGRSNSARHLRGKALRSICTSPGSSAEWFRRPTGTWPSTSGSTSNYAPSQPSM
jgi:hypothetical protein